MDGAAAREKKLLDLAMFQSWHVEAFARMDKRTFKHALSNYLKRGDGEPIASKAAEAVAWAHRMKARGFDIQITKHELN